MADFHGIGIEFADWKRIGDGVGTGLAFIDLQWTDRLDWQWIGFGLIIGVPGSVPGMKSSSVENSGLSA